MAEGRVELPTNFDRPIPAWVPEPIRDRVIDRKDRTNWLRSVNEEIHSDLNLEKNLPSVDANRVGRFYDQLAISVVESAEELHIPIPRTSTTESWGLYRILKARKEVPDSDASESPDEYVVKIHPGKIEKLLELPSYSQKIETDLVIRHEMFHLWEEIHEPEIQEETKKQLELLRREQPGIHQEVKQTLTGKEMRARMYELEVLKKEDVKTARQFLLKSLLIVLMKAELIQRGKRRKDLKITF